jgi:hypothetical protein
LWEAFLIQMDDFDRFLEFELRQMLDPVVASGTPRRRRHKGANGHLLLTVGPLDLAVEAVVEPVAIPVTVVP